MADLFLAYIFGMVMGAILMIPVIQTIKVKRTPKYVGNLRIDTSIPDEPPYIFLELYKGIGDISDERSVTLEVCKNYNSQK